LLRIPLVSALFVSVGVTPVRSDVLERDLPILVGESPMRGGIDTKIILRKGIGPQVTRRMRETFRVY
jgi:hypothetical protein